MFTEFFTWVNKGLTYLNIDNKVKNRAYLVIGFFTLGWFWYVSIYTVRNINRLRGWMFVLLALVLTYFYILNIIYYYSNATAKWDITYFLAYKLHLGVNKEDLKGIPTTFEPNDNIILWSGSEVSDSADENIPINLTLGEYLDNYINMLAGLPYVKYFSKTEFNVDTPKRSRVDYHQNNKDNVFNLLSTDLKDNISSAGEKLSNASSKLSNLLTSGDDHRVNIEVTGVLLKVNNDDIDVYLPNAKNTDKYVLVGKITEINGMTVSNAVISDGDIEPQRVEIVGGKFTSRGIMYDTPYTIRLFLKE